MDESKASKFKGKPVSADRPAAAAEKCWCRCGCDRTLTVGQVEYCAACATGSHILTYAPEDSLEDAMLAHYGKRGRTPVAAPVVGEGERARLLSLGLTEEEVNEEERYDDALTAIEQHAKARCECSTKPQCLRAIELVARESTPAPVLPNVEPWIDRAASRIAQNVAGYMQAFKPEPTPSAAGKIAAIIREEQPPAPNVEELSREIVEAITLTPVQPLLVEKVAAILTSKIGGTR